MTEASVSLSPAGGNPREWLVIRQTRALAEEEAVVSALLQSAAHDGRTVTVVLLGRASYDLESASHGPPDKSAGIRYALLREDVAARGLRPPVGVVPEQLDYREFIQRLFSAERVIQLG